MKVSTNIIIIMISLLAACNQPQQPKASEQELIDADHAFAELAAKEGIGKAFITYADSSAIIMHNARMPLKGIDDITKVYSQIPNNLSLEWEPTKAEIAGSGDMGYTFGKYTFTSGDSVEYGHYLTFWKKDRTGTWKYVVDTGTENPK